MDQKIDNFNVVGKTESVGDFRRNPLLMFKRKEKNLTIITLGTGIPVPDIARAGPSNAIIYKKTCIIVDCGRWVTRQLLMANIAFKQIKGVIFTHLHQDHINAWPCLWMDSLFCGRTTPWQIWGPVGTTECIDAIKKFNDRDIQDRITVEIPLGGIETRVTELKDVYSWELGGIKITGVPVFHSQDPNSFGFRFDTPEKSILVSGDTKKSENLIKLGKRAPVDVLVHEICLGEIIHFAIKANFFLGTEKTAKFITYYHSQISEIIEVAKEIQPKKLVLTHIMPSIASPDYIVKTIKENFDGEVVCANDLDSF